MPASLTLVSHHLCPYVQRAAIALAEKAVPFKRIDIDLGDKPDWFKALSPLGKVPVLIVELDDARRVTVFESAVILEYLEETQSNPLHPSDALERAEHRAWIEFGSAVLNNIGALYSAPNAMTFNDIVAVLVGQFERLEAVLEGGPYFSGTQFSLVDAAFGPIFRYFDVFDEVRIFGAFDTTPAVRKWRMALAQRSSVQGAVREDYASALRQFLKRGDSHLSSMIG